MQRFLFAFLFLVILTRLEAQQNSHIPCKGDAFTKPAIIEGFFSDTSFNTTMEVIGRDSLKNIKKLIPPYATLKITGFNYYVDGPGIDCETCTYFVNGDTFKEHDLAIINQLRDKCLLVIECVFALNSAGQRLRLPSKVYYIRE